MSTDESPVQPGDVLAQKYRVDRVLGVGGMGVVVAATHLQLEERFALKFMLPWALADQQAVERFAREARAAVRLKSTHAARVVDVGTLETGSPFMVMEFLEGADLAAIVEGHRQLPVEEAADYVLQACDAVAEAHSLGIVHRDLKPRNLFRVTGHDGNPLIKVLDFGISKMRGAADLSLTKTTEVIGSPSYMSPEQLRSSRDVDERTDVWALGVILFELLGGVVPFDAETVTQLTAMVLLDKARSVRELRPDVPEAVEQLIAQCLAKDPSSRIQSVADIADILDGFAPEHSRGLARRIRQVAETRGGRSVPPSSLGTGPMSAPRSGQSAGPVSRVPVSVPVTGGTSVSWSKTELAASPSTSSQMARTGDPPEPRAPAGDPPARWGLIALFMLVGTGLGVGLVFLFYSRAVGAPAPVVAAAADSASSAAPKSSAVDPPTAASAQPVSAESATTTATDTPTAAAPVATTSKPVKPRGPTHAARDAGAPPSSDDIPSDRR
jgi:eukaryotic-like serine/threonine-protein kinase